MSTAKTVYGLPLDCFEAFNKYGKIDSKKQFLFWLIPYFPVIYTAVKKFRGLK